MSTRLWIVANICIAAMASPSWAGDAHNGHAATAATPAMDHGAMPMDHDMHAQEPNAAAQDKQSGNDAQHTGVHDAAPDATRDATATDLRDPHAYADGYDFSQFGMRHQDEHTRYGVVRAERLELVNTDDNTFTVYDVQARYGDGFNAVVLKAEGVGDDGELDHSETELLMSRAVAAFWDAQLGVRYDGGAGPNRTWLAAGVQGLAPYWFDVDATAYVGSHGRTALSVEADYELLFTQKLVLQPRVEIMLYGKDDIARGTASGLAETAAGLRLRYEFRREFAPYVGVERVNLFGGTADLARAAAEPTADTRVIGGVRFWF